MVCAQYFFPAQWHLLQPAEVGLFFSLGFCSWEPQGGSQTVRWILEHLKVLVLLREVLLSFSRSSGGSREGMECSPSCLCCLTGHHWAVGHRAPCHSCGRSTLCSSAEWNEMNASLCLGCSSLLQLWRHLNNSLAFTPSSCIFCFCFRACTSAHQALNQMELCLSCSLRSGVILIWQLWQVQEVSVKEQNSLSNSLAS